MPLVPSGEIIPSGAIDGLNSVFTLPNPPSPASTLQIFMDGVYQQSGYALLGNTITFSSPPVPGTALAAFYTYDSTTAVGAPDDLCDLDAVKAWLSGSSAMGSADDVLLTRLITGASRFLLKQMNRKTFTVQPYSERFSGTGNGRFVPKVDPVTAITLVSVGKTVVPLSPDAIQSGYVLIDTIGNQYVQLIAYAFEIGVANCLVEYLAGYVSIPEDVQQACVELVGGKYRRRKRIGSVQEALPQGGGTATFTPADVTPDIQDVIDQYSLRF